MKPRHITLFLLLVAASLCAGVQAASRFSLKDVHAQAGKSMLLPLYLDNTDEITALQFDIVVPQECSLAPGEYVATQRISGHTVQGMPVSDNRYRFIIISGTNASVLGNSGQLLAIPLNVGSSLVEGESYPISLENVTLARRNGDAIVTEAVAAELTIEQSPDIMPAAVTPGATSAVPGEVLPVSWSVTNAGGVSLEKGWREDIILTDALGAECIAATTSYEGDLSAGGSVSRSADIRIPDIPGVSGPCSLSVRLTPFAGSGERPEAAGNNTATASSTLDMAKRIYISGAALIPENNGAPVTYTVTRSGNPSAEESFTISGISDSRLSAPTRFPIPAGAYSGTFSLSVTDNNVLDDDLPFMLTAGGTGYPDASLQVAAIDDETPSLSFEGEPDEVTEGESFTMKLKREKAYPKETSFNLACDKPLRFQFPEQVVIPAGKDEVEFTVTTVDNSDVEIRESASFSASAPGYLSGNTYLFINDDDLPEIDMVLSPSTVKEDAGGSAIVARITRTGGSDSAITLRISDNSEGTLYYTTREIRLEKGVNSAMFNIGVCDNDLADGDRQYRISAAVYSSKCNCSALGEQRGAVTRTVTVTDNDGAALTLTSSRTALLEGSSDNIFTVTRNADTDKALIVRLSSDSAGRILFPATATIPAGERSAQIIVSVPENNESSDGAIVAIVAEADGYSSGSCWVQLTDTSLPDAVISAIAADKESAMPGETVNFTVTVTNSGNRSLPEKTPVFLRYDNAAQHFVAYTSSILNPGQSEDVIKTVTMPREVGSYKFHASVNDEKSISELNYLNNNSGQLAIRVTGDITVTLSADREALLPGESIRFSGKASGAVAEGKEVEIYVINNGLRQSMNVKMAADGSFTGEWSPMARQTGATIAGACYPGDNKRDALVRFNVMGLRMDKIIDTRNVVLGTKETGRFALTNLCDVAISGLAVTGDIPSNFKFTVPSSVPAGQTTYLEYEITGDTATPGEEWLLCKPSLTGNGIAAQPLAFYYFVHTPQAKLVLDETALNTTVTKGKGRNIIVRLTNEGMGETGKVTVTPSECGWLSLASPASMGSIAPGESAEVVLSLSTTPDMQLNNAVNAGVAFNCENGDGVAMTLRVVPVSDETGQFTFDVCDEYTYLTAEGPHLEGAEVTVMHYANRNVVASGVTGADGLFSVTLPEGYYYATVTDPRHDSWEGTISVAPGMESKRRINLGIQGVTVNIRYESTEVEDEYEIVTEVKYETNVPAPVVEVILPESLDIDALQPGESLLFNAVMTNKGLITAANTQLLIPEAPEGFTISYPDTDTFDLPAGTTRVVPVMLSRNPQPQNAPARASGKGGCHMETITYYESYCGEDKKIHYVPHTIRIRVCTGNPGAPGGPTWGGWNTGWHIGGPGVGGPTVKPGPSSPKHEKPDTPGLGDKIADKLESFVCDPCVNGFMKEAAKCNDYDPDHPVQSIIKKIPIVGDALGCIFDLWNDYHESGKISGGSIFGCAMQACQAAGGVLVGIGGATAAEGVGVAIAAAGKGLSALCEFLDEGKGWYDCGKGLLNPCPKDSGNKGNKIIARENTFSGYPSYIEQWQDKMRFFYPAYDATIDIAREILGDKMFYSSDMGQLAELFAGLRLTPAGELHDPEVMRTYKPDNVSDDLFDAFMTRINNSIRIENGETVDGPHIDYARIDALMAKIGDMVEYSESLGYATPADMVTDAYTQLAEGYETESNSICSSVTLRISQRLAMTRQAVRATLDVTNGHASEAMTDFKVSFNVYDGNGALVGSDKMQIAPESLRGFTGENSLTAGWSLASRSDGTATILFIPTRYAAENGDEDYTFTGCISYTDPFTGLTVSRELSPATLTVSPSPVIDMTYLMQRDVFGDDPLTSDVAEPSIPSEFALILTNKGKGEAANLRMTTRQPVITDNEKGLDVKFEIVSSQVNGKEATLAFGDAVVNDFGNIAAGSSAYAQWWIKSSLLGHYRDYDVRATHLTSYGNENLSLLDRVEIKELIHGFTPDTAVPGDDSETIPVRAFLTNETKDLNDTPDFVRFSDGSEGCSAGSAKAEITHVEGDTYRLSISPDAAGWCYGNLLDPTAGRAKLMEVRRVGGRQVPLDNVWQTDRTLRDSREPLYEYRLHFVANAADAADMEYLLTFEPRPETELEVIEFGGLPAEGTTASEPVEKVTVTFSKDVDPATFTTAALTLTCQSKTLTLDNATVSRLGARQYEIALPGITTGNGYYVLTVGTASLRDTEGYFGAPGKSASWIQLGKDGYSLDITCVPADGGRVTPASGKVTPGTKASLKATPSDGYQFAGWRIDGEVFDYEPETEHVIVADTHIEAIFKPLTYGVNITCDASQGSVDGAGTGIYDFGTELRLVALPEPGYEFAGWTIEGKDAGHERVLTVTVKGDTNIGVIFSPLPGGRDADVEYSFGRGWNWVSFSAFNDTEVRDILSAVRRNFREFRNGGDVVTFDGSDWTGNVTVSSLGGYKLRFEESTPMNSIGVTPDATDLTVTLQPGLNRIGYPLFHSLSVNEALASLSAEEGDVIRGHESFAIYNGSDWVGTLTELLPGHMYEITVSNLISFSWPAVTETSLSASTVTQERRHETGWKVNPADYPANMGVVAVLRAGNTRADQTGRYTIGAFDSAGNCLGISSESDGRHFLTIHSDGNLPEGVHLRVHDRESNNIYEVNNARLPFSESVTGTVTNPYVIETGVVVGMDNFGADVISVYPNPATDILFIRGISDSNAEITLVNANGVRSLRMRGLPADGNIDVSHLPTGIYMLIVDTSEGTFRTKVIIDRN